MTQVFVPRESVNDQTVLIQRVRVPSGTAVQADAVVVEIETSKTVLEVQAPSSGVIVHALKEGQEVEVGALLFTVQGADTASAAPVPPATSPEAPPVSPVAQAPAAAQLDQTPAAQGGPAVLSKAAQAAASRLGIALDAFQGRWVTRADIERGRPAETRAEQASGVIDTAREPAPKVSLSVDQTYEERALTMRKRAEVDNLTLGQHAETASTIGIVISLPGNRLVAPDFLFRDSISDLVVFESARLFREYPELNAFNMDGKRIGLYANINFGISFDNVANLKVLTLRHADKLNLPELQRGISGLLDIFESNKPIPAELLGGSTVTLSDLSATSASFMLPLLNGRQSLILGIVKRSPGTFEVIVSFDHRVTEGLRVTRFLEALRDRVLSHYRDSKGQVRIACRFCGKAMQDELHLGHRGMLNMTLPSGETAVLCRNCFEGR